MNYCKTLFFFSSLLLWSFTSKGQNYLMPNGYSSFHGSVTLSTGNFEDALAISPGYTMNGRYTFGTELGKGKDHLNNLSSTIIRPHLSALILKQNDTQIPLSIGIELGYEINILPTTSFNSRTLQLSSDLFYEFVIQNDVLVIPHASLLAERPISKNGLTVEKNIITSTNFGVSFVWSKIYFDTGFFLGNNNRGYYLSVGYII